MCPVPVRTRGPAEPCPGAPARAGSSCAARAPATDSAAHRISHACNHDREAPGIVSTSDSILDVYAEQSRRRMDQDGHMTRSNRMRCVCGAALLGALAAACGSTNNPYNGGNPIGVQPDGGQGAVTMMLGMSPRFGNYLVDGSGRTLYLFALDLPAGGGNPAVSNCGGSPSDTTSCIYLWPIFHAATVNVQGINASDVGGLSPVLLQARRQSRRHRRRGHP